MDLNDTRLYLALALAFLFFYPRESRASEGTDPDDFDGYGGGDFGGGGAGGTF